VDYQPQNSSNAAQGDDDEGEGFDWQKAMGYLRFAGGSIRRRKLTVAVVFVSVFGLTYLALWLMPRSYHVETQLLAQRNQVIGNLAVAGRNMPEGAPTRAAAETVLRRDNLIALMQQVDLMAKWDASRSRASQLRSWIYAKLGRTMSQEDKADMILGTLEDKLTVKVVSDQMGEGTVNIAIDWPDPRMGYRLVTAAQQSFIEARHLSEISSISEAVSILVTRATSMRREIDSTLRLIDEKKAALTKGSTRRRSSAGSLVRAPLPDSIPQADREAIQQLAEMIESKKQAIKDLDGARRRRIDELQTKLAELRATLAESHPNIIDAVQTIETLQQESPGLAQLKKDEAQLTAQYQARVARTAQPVEKPAPPVQDSAQLREQAAPSEDDDREMEFAKNQLRFQADAYSRLLERLEGARMEQDSARAAFKYRYVVIHPAQIPREAEKPKTAKILGGGFVAALLLALLAALAVDLRSGRVYAPWQLERALRLPVLAEIRRDG
jgi:uncharacterized protein involved in exopolysaccharide biosynthesis